MTLDPTSRQLAEIAKCGHTMVFTNGCFDLLHPGHIHLLQFAAAQGDYFVVALNNDSSVNRLKGEGRPVQPLQERMDAVRQVPGVDAVIAFGDDTAVPLLELIRPQVYVKGADYEGHYFPEAKSVQAYGGKVLYCPSLQGYSTTAILARGKQK